jgi:predicted Ser/Thr protein kinase
MTMTGRVAGNYRILEKLGEGGMGAVYRAVDAMVERQVAIKVLKAEIAGNPEILERFRSEAVTLARLNHSSIATLYSFFRQEDEYFMVMEFVPGRTLDDVIRSEGAMPWRAATDLLIHLLEALQHAHFLGILHRDIKPANIMLTPTRGVKVTDFGIARALGSARLTREGRMVGTLEYLAPERVMGKPFDERSDLYSVGVVFYEMLSGRVPFENDSDYALIRAQAEQQPPPLTEFGVSVPQPVVDVLMKSLAKNPEERFPNAASMAAALLAAKIRAESAAPVIGPVIKETRLAPEPSLSAPVKNSRMRLWIIAAAVLLITAAALGTDVMHRRSVAAKQAADEVQQLRAQRAAAEAAQVEAAQPPIATPVPVRVIEQPIEQHIEEPRPEPPRRQRQQAIPSAITQPSPATPAPAPAVEAPPALSVAANPPPAIPVNPAPVAREIPAAPPVRSIREIQTLLVERMSEGLDGFIRDEIRMQLHNRLEVVSSPEQADAIMRCDVEKEEGGHKVTNATARVFGAKGHESATVRVYDRSGRQLLWEEEVTDKRGVMGIHGGENKLASRIVGKLKKQLK